MHIKKMNSTGMIFWLLVITLLSAISTTIFSESFINESFGYSLMFFAIIGLSLNIIHICLHAILDICNPSH
ncbi:hypothetical protein [Acinetobacter sp. KS-LM10]|uniref:hypothetical protein n=1 Tax=Acinetobacter sp. KS-LM10 TaxID=3120518 RepID=UPI0030D0176A